MPASTGGAIGHGDENGSSGVHDHHQPPAISAQLHEQPFSKFSNVQVAPGSHVHQFWPECWSSVEQIELPNCGSRHEQSLNPRAAVSGGAVDDELHPVTSSANKTQRMPKLNSIRRPSAGCEFRALTIDAAREPTRDHDTEVAALCLHWCSGSD